MPETKRRGVHRDTRKAAAARWTPSGRLAAAIATILAFSADLTRDQRAQLQRVLDRPIGTLTGVALDRALTVFDLPGKLADIAVAVDRYLCTCAWRPGEQDIDPECPVHVHQHMDGWGGGELSGDAYDRAAEGEARDRNARWVCGHAGCLGSGCNA